MQRMRPNDVRRLEERLEEMMEEVVAELGLNRPPRTPTPHTFQMMAKAATAVYEAAMDNASEPRHS